MLKPAIAIERADDLRFATIKHIGVDHLVYYDMANTADKFEAFERFVENARAHDLTVPIVESGPSLRRTIEGTDDGEETRLWVEALPFLARLGVEVVCYNFMPQVTDDAMVLRTGDAFKTRGGALTTGYQPSAVSPALIKYPAKAAGSAEMWKCLEAFLNEIVPKAEATGIALAMHPDDPPLHDILGYHRIMSDAEDFARLIETVPSPSNGMTLCAGCFGEAGYDVTKIARRFAEAVKFVHYRNIGDIDDGFIETFADDGKLDLTGMISVLLEVGVDAYIRCDHSPLLALEEQDAPTGYGFLGHLYTTGYMKGLIDAISRPRAHDGAAA